MPEVNVPVSSDNYKYNEQDNILNTSIDMTTYETRYNPYNVIRRVCRYQRSNQNPYIEEEQTTQWPNEIV